MAYTDLGALLRLKPVHGRTVELFVNPVLLLELVYCIDEAADAQRWQLREQRAPLLRLVKGETWRDIPHAKQASSLRLGSAPDGAILAIRDGRDIAHYYLSVTLIASIFGTLGIANETAGWWDENMRLNPNDGTNLQ